MYQLEGSGFAPVSLVKEGFNLASKPSFYELANDTITTALLVSCELAMSC